MSMREQLLGYLLGALEPAEREAVERALAERPELRSELEALRAELAPLEAGRMEYEPPGDLSERTCELVALHQSQSQHPSVQPASRLRPARRMSSAFDVLVGTGGMSLADGVVAIGVCVAVAILFFPAIISSREAARKTFCQDNLRRIGLALHAYADTFGTAPYIPLRGNRAIAGNVPVTLQEMELIMANYVLCPGAESEFPDFRIPRAAELDRATGLLLSYLQRMAGGHYANSLGVRVNNRYGPARFEARQWFAVVADAPTPHLAGRVTSNHGGRGFNVLFEDGHIQFLRGCRLLATDDDLFRSADGYIESGSFKNDSSLGASNAHPSPQLFWAN